MHPLIIILLTINLIGLIEFLIKKPLIVLINIIIVILNLNFYTLSLIIFIERTNFIWIYHLTTFSGSHNGFNRKWITIFEIKVIQQVFKMIKFYLSKMTKNLNKFALIAYQFQDIYCLFNADTLHGFHVSENIEDIYLFEKQFPCPICKQFCHLNEIYSYQVKKTKCPNYLLMKMFKRAKFISSQAKCGVSYLLEKIHHHEMFECPHQSILSCTRLSNYQ